MAAKCEECGCICKQCNNHEQKHNDMHLHVEIENLRQRLVERDHHIVTMETQFLNEAEKFPNGELASLKEEVIVWQDKYSRLYEAHKRVQKVNQNLEDKLLRIVDKCETEKGAFTKDIATLSHRLADANYTIHRLTQDNEKYRNDVNLAIQLLQCKPSNFVGQKYESLPPEVQAKVRSYVAQKGRIGESSSPEVRSITVPISTFPPTAMVYNVAKPVVDKQDVNSDDESKPPIDVVSAAIMAKVLEDREKERIFTRHCNTCTCHRSVLKVDAECQTALDNDKLPTTKDYFSNELKDAIISKENLQLENRDSTVGFTKSFSPLSDSNAKRATFHCINEVAEAKQKLNSEHSKMSNCYNASANANTKNYLNLKNSSQQRNLNSVIVDINVDGNKPKTISDGDRNEAQNSLNNNKKSPSERKSAKEIKNLDDQAKIDMINERLWKSSWMSSQNATSPRDSDAQLDVINERDWRRSSSRSSKAPERPARLTVIEVKSADDLTSQGDKTQSSSFGGDSPAVSSSDPSSLSSDPVPNQPPPQSRKERVTGPRSCLVRVTPGSKNILLDNVDTYQTVLYTSGCSRPNTALVHLAKSSRSGRSVADSVSSEENGPAGHDSSHLQRVAQWVDTLSSDCEQRNAQSVDICSSEEPLLSATLSPKNESPAGLPEDQRDLMTFEGSSDDERKLNIAHDCQANITKEIEEAYLKLAASLETPNLRPKPVDIDLMTIEKYRTEQKRSRKSSLAKSQPTT